jgi:DNA topoisomerase IA
MAQTLIIAEKPAMGRDIADALSHLLGTSVRNDGLCQHVGSYTVIGAQGCVFRTNVTGDFGIVTEDSGPS